VQSGISQKAAALFEKGFNCAESVSMAMSDFLGIKTDIIPKIATPFGGGIGRRGSVCGAASGAIMAIGLKYGRMEPDEDKEKAYGLALKFYERFEKEFGSVLCYDLIECDLTTSEGRKKAKDLKIHEEKCFKFVERAVDILAGLMRK
jgi:C_GCAxxG_C_C family probable redox protein